MAQNKIHFYFQAHLVYFNRKYGNLYDAMKHEDGLAVVATLITVPFLTYLFGQMVARVYYIQF